MKPIIMAYLKALACLVLGIFGAGVGLGGLAVSFACNH